MTLTPDGEALVGYGRRILKLTEEAMARFHAPQMEGTIRLGTPDDYAGKFLPDILARFAASHPNIEVDVFCQSSFDLIEHLDDNRIDIALVSAGHSRRSGHVVHREALVWAGLRHGCAHEQRPLQLALSHVGCCWRTAALDALNRAGIPHRVAYSSRHYMGQLAAVLSAARDRAFPALHRHRRPEGRGRGSRTAADRHSTKSSSVAHRTRRVRSSTRLPRTSRTASAAIPSRRRDREASSARVKGAARALSGDCFPMKLILPVRVIASQRRCSRR